MNLVSCAEKCCYQKDGQCLLPPNSSASASPIKSCCYFVSDDENGGDMNKSNKNAQKNDTIFVNFIY